MIVLRGIAGAMVNPWYSPLLRRKLSSEKSHPSQTGVAAAATRWRTR
jgi:hypothetical protein